MLKKNPANLKHEKTQKKKKTINTKTKPNQYPKTNLKQCNYI
jgi:hypothetical protein